MLKFLWFCFFVDTVYNFRKRIYFSYNNYRHVSCLKLKDLSCCLVFMLLDVCGTSYFSK